MNGSDRYTNPYEAPASSPSSAADLRGVAEMWARVKVLNPLTSTGPSMHAELISSSETDVHLRVPRCIFRGSSVQVRTHQGIVFGAVQSCVAAGSEFEIGVALHGTL
jgi:hypothetical protein